MKKPPRRIAAGMRRNQPPSAATQRPLLGGGAGALRLAARVGTALMSCVLPGQDDAGITWPAEPDGFARMRPRTPRSEKERSEPSAARGLDFDAGQGAKHHAFPHGPGEGVVSRGAAIEMRQAFRAHRQKGVARRRTPFHGAAPSLDPPRLS